MLFSVVLARYNPVYVYPQTRKTPLQIDDDWGKLLTKHGDAIPEWTPLAIERMLACGTPVMGLRRYC